MEYHPDRHPEVARNEVLRKLLSEQFNRVKQAHDFLMDFEEHIRSQRGGPSASPVPQNDRFEVSDEEEEDENEEDENEEVEDSLDAFEKDSAGQQASTNEPDLAEEPIRSCLTCGSNLSSGGICDACRRSKARSVPQNEPNSSWSEILFHSIWLAAGAGCLIGIALGAAAGVVGGATIGFLFFVVKASSRSRGGTGFGLVVGLVVAVVAFAIVYNKAYDSFGGGRFDSINAMHDHELVRRRVAIVAAAMVSIVTGTLAFAVAKGLAGRRN